MYSFQVSRDVNIGLVLENAPMNVIWSVEIAHRLGFSRCPAQLVSGSQKGIWAPKLIRNRCCEVSKLLAVVGFGMTLGGSKLRFQLALQLEGLLGR